MPPPKSGLSRSLSSWRHPALGPDDRASRPQCCAVEPDERRRSGFARPSSSSCAASGIALCGYLGRRSGHRALTAAGDSEGELAEAAPLGPSRPHYGAAQPSLQTTALDSTPGRCLRRERDSDRRSFGRCPRATLAPTTRCRPHRWPSIRNGPGCSAISGGRSSRSGSGGSSCSPISPHRQGPS